MNPIGRYRELNEEAGKYNRPEFAEVYKYIWQGLSDEEALKKSGFLDDVDFVKDFMKYRNVESEASKIQQDALCKAVQSTTHGVSIDEAMQNAGFSQSPELQSILDTIIDSETTKNPYFPYPKPFAGLIKGDESIDGLLKIDNYHIKGALQCYYYLLRDVNIEELLGKIGITLEDLLTILNEITTTIEHNTNKPIFLENKIIEILNTLSEHIGCGQVLQILILQGVLSWFEHCDINEGDNGYFEARSLCDWVYKKQVEVCCLYFTAFVHNKNSEPLDVLLAKTGIGQAWERYINNDNTPPAPSQPQQVSNNQETLKPNLNHDNKAAAPQLENEKLCRLFWADAIPSFFEIEAKLITDNYIDATLRWVQQRKKKDLAEFIVVLKECGYFRKRGINNKDLTYKDYRSFFEQRYKVNISKQMQPANRPNGGKTFILYPIVKQR